MEYENNLNIILPIKTKINLNTKLSTQEVKAKVPKMKMEIQTRAVYSRTDTVFKILISTQGQHKDKKK